MGMSEFYGVGDDNESVATIHEPLTRASTSSTRPTCMALHNELLVGRAIAGGATKWCSRPSSAISAVRTAPSSGQRTPEYVLKCCDDSLRRLDVDVIDLYYQHVWIARCPSRDWGAMKSSWKPARSATGHLGGSSATIEKAHAVHPIAGCRASIRSGPATRRRCPGDLSRARHRFCRYSPLGRLPHDESSNREGTQERDFRRATRFSVTPTRRTTAGRNLESSPGRRHLGGAAGLAWVLSRGTDVVPIPGTKRRKWLLENIAASSIVLSDADCPPWSQPCRVARSRASATTRRA